MNPLLAFNLDDVRMFSFNERTILLTIGSNSERIEFASHEEMRAALHEWLDRSVPEDKGFPEQRAENSGSR